MGALCARHDPSDNDSMRRFFIAVLALGSLSLTSCGSVPSVQIETRDDLVLARASAPSSEAFQAIISGRLSILEGRCIGLSGGGVEYVAVFSAGTTLLDNGVAIPDLGEFEFGDTIRGQGGVVPRAALTDPGAEWIDSLPDECPSDQIYMFTP